MGGHTSRCGKLNIARILWEDGKTFSLVLVILRAISLISAVKVLWGVQINQISVLLYRCHKLGL